MSEHREESTSEVRRGTYYEFRIACICGVTARGGLSPTRDSALRQAQRSFVEHLPPAPKSLTEHFPVARNLPSTPNNGEAKNRDVIAALVCVSLVLVAVVGAVLLFAAGSVSDSQDTQPAPLSDRASVTAPTPTPAGTASADEVEEEETGDEKSEQVGPRREPSESGETPSNGLDLPRAVIIRLGQAADVYGYGLGPGTQMTYKRAANFAYAVSFTCDDWRAGISTFQDSVDEDVSTGAPVEDARGMNRFLESEFCPAYYDAGN